MSGVTRSIMKTLSVVSLLFMLALFTRCSESGGISSQITDQFNRGDTIDLALVGPDDWDRVCILGPYSGNETAQQVLGFAWDAEAHTTIAWNDGINVLVFSAKKTVVAYSEHPRNAGDFVSIASTCSSRRDARLTRKQGSSVLAWTRTDET